MISEPRAPAVLTARPVETIADVELVRRIRNQSLDGLTKNAYPTTELEQIKYWLDNMASLRAWLYSVDMRQIIGRDGRFKHWIVTPGEYVQIIGYASLRRAEDRKLWSFMAVLPHFRGYGLGREIQHHHVRQTDEDVYDEILETNVASLRMTASSGDWRVIDRRDGLVYQISEARMRT